MAARFVYTWDVTLLPGKHKVQVVGIKNGKKHRDEVNWDVTFTPPTTQPSAPRSDDAATIPWRR